MSWINREIHNKNNDGEKTYPFARWMSWLFFVASILSLVYTYYRSEIIFQGGMQSYYIKYYLISLTAALFWVFVLWLREGIRANIVTLVISLVAGLYLFEWGLRLFFVDMVSHDRVAVAAELGIDYDQRTKQEVIEDLIEKGVDAVPNVFGAEFRNIIGVTTSDIDQLFPLGGVSNTTTVSINETGKYLVFKSDRYGFNNPDSQWDSKSIDWIIIGDSFAFGQAVQPGQEIAGQIRSITANNVISLGMGGAGPLLEYAALVEYKKTFTPSNVLWFYFEGNDINRNNKNTSGNLMKEKDNPFLMQYMEGGFSQNLINRQEEIDRFLREYIVQKQIKEEQKKTGWVRLAEIRKLVGIDGYGKYFAGKWYPTPDELSNIQLEDSKDIFNLSLFAEILAKAKETVELWGGELHFIYLPEYDRYNNKSISHQNFKKKTEVIDLVKQLDIPVIDIHKEVFANHSNPLSLFPFRLPGHYNADGYSEIAKAIVISVNKYEQSNK